MLTSAQTGGDLEGNGMEGMKGYDFDGRKKERERLERREQPPAPSLSPVPQLRQLDKRSVRRREIADKSVFRSVNKFLLPLPPVNERGKVFHLLRFSYKISLQHLDY